MDEVFRALADPTRRSLLDELFREDGQTLHALDERLPMSRFGVMKHLKVLEDAGLVVTRRRGREKLHFLNPVPIRLVHDRWVSKYAEPWAAGLSALKRDLEAGPAVAEIWIRAAPEGVREAIAARADADPAPAVAWEVEPAGEVCRVRVLDERPHPADWPLILSGLKSLLETGEALPAPAPPPGAAAQRTG